MLVRSYCKCRACKACHNGSAALPEWASGPHARCLSFGQCDEWNAQQAQLAAEREAERQLARSIFQAELKAERGRERAEYWASRRSGGGGALCNTSADCSHHGECRVPAAAAPLIFAPGNASIVLVNNVSIRINTASGRQPIARANSNSTIYANSSAGRPPRCFCEDGFAGARCAYAAFSKMRSGGASCNRTTPCGGEGSSCVRSRCVCGRGWLGARCSFAGFSVLAANSGGATCNRSSDCGGDAVGSRCLRVPAAALTGRCKCAIGRVGARCAFAAFGMLEGGGGSCNISSQCHPGPSVGITASSLAPRSTQSPPPPPPPPSPAQMPPPGNGAGEASGYNQSRCEQGRCVCATGRLGAHCLYTSDMLIGAARARARREHERVRGLHLCLSAWRAGGDLAEGVAEDTAPLREPSAQKKKPHGSASRRRGGEQATDKEPPVLREGTPLSFALCRHQRRRHQEWNLEPVRHQARRAGEVDPPSGPFRIRSVAEPGLCVTVPPMYAAQ